MPVASVAHIQVAVPKEVSCALKKVVAQAGRVSYTLLMPDQPAADKDTITVRVTRALKTRLQKLADQRGESLTDVVISFLMKAVKGVELTPEDYKKIAEEMEAASSRRKTKSPKSK